MPKITSITPQLKNHDRWNVFIDGEWCCGIRKRTFQDMELQVGDEISCAELQEKESFFWKEKYGKVAWQKEKIRIEKIIEIIENISDEVTFIIVGFGTDSDEMIKEHPEEKGKPDIDIVLKANPALRLMKVEVTGTERLRGQGYWVRPDKIEYAENHPEEDVWIALHYAEPETIRFIKPMPHKIYGRQTKEINGVGEIFCIFNDNEQEVKTPEEFAVYLNELVKKVKNN